MPNESADNFVDFGHWRPEDPQASQASLLEGDTLPVLTNQLVTMSKIAWTKHRRVQNSVCCSPVSESPSSSWLPPLDERAYGTLLDGRSPDG
jgi:Family of unknown function (DUF5706)